MDVPSTLASISAAIDTARLLRDANKAWDAAEYKFRIAELISALTDSRVAVGDLQDEIRDLRNQIAALEQQAALVQEMRWESPFYWREGASGREGPFCQRCFDSERKPVRLVPGMNGSFRCHECKSSYMSDEAKAHLDAKLRPPSGAPGPWV